jgi:integrase
MAAYEAAVRGPKSPEKSKNAQGSLAWLIARYRESATWMALSMATRRQRENIFKHIIESAGSLTFATIDRADIAAGRDRRAKTPAQANNFLKAMRGLFQWACEAQLIATDPTLGLKGVSLKSEGFHVWTDEEIARFESRWPVGTRERLAIAVLLCTGLRRGDAARLGRQHIRNGVILLRAEKTKTQVAIPILPELQAVLDASPTGDLALIARYDGAPFTKESFGNWFKDACKAAGVPGSAHGLRKAGATRAAENGATEKELNAIFGWTGNKMASHYTQTADRARLAKAAIGKLSRNETGPANPAPEVNFPAPKINDK